MISSAQPTRDSGTAWLRRRLARNWRFRQKRRFRPQKRSFGGCGTRQVGRGDGD